MPRRLTAAFVALLVPLAAATAPLLHVHLDEHDSDHHRGRALHGHFSGHDHAPTDSPGARAEGDDDGRTLTPNLFVAVAPADSGIPAIVTQYRVLVVPPERTVRLVPRVAHGHDPPILASVPPRAPPSSLS